MIEIKQLIVAFSYMFFFPLGLETFIFVRNFLTRYYFITLKS